MQDSVCILIATYNGEKYIREQIESLRRQSYSHFKMYINDDCSDDATYQIIQEIAAHDRRIECSRHYCGGAAENFRYLIEQHMDEDYVFLCDQDDVWDSSKVELCLEAMKRESQNNPVLVYCNRQYVDQALNPIEVKERVYQDDIKRILCQNHIYGCSMLMNNALLRLLNFPPSLAMHDYWIALVAATKGKIIRIDSKLLLYRQHQNNVTGGLAQFGILEKLKAWEQVNTIQHETIAMCLQFCSLHYDDNVALSSYINIFKRVGVNRLIEAIRFGYKRDNSLATLRGYLTLLTYRKEEG